MLIEVHFPVTDLRAFIDEAPERLSRPSWPFPIPLREFVRGTGSIDVRRKGAIDPWGDESCYCTADRALKFPDELHKAGSGRCCFQGIFRRLFFNGDVVARFSVGISPSSGTLENALDDALLIPMRVGSKTPAPLVASGAALAAHWLAMTASARSGSLKGSWAVAGTPLVIGTGTISEFGDPKRLRLARRLGQEVELFSDDDVLCLFRRVTAASNYAESWAILSGPTADRDLVRRLRLHLGRLHAERESLKAVFRAIRSGEVAAGIGSESLQSYLNRALNWQESRAPSGVSSAEILEASAKAQDLVTEGERGQLLAAISEIRGNILAKVVRVTRTADEGRPTILVAVNSLSMDDHSTNIKADQVAGVVAGQGNTTGDIFGRIELIRGSTASDQVRRLLEDLAPAFSQVAAKLPEDQRPEAEREMDELIKESVAPNAQGARVRTLSERVAERAKAVGAVGASVLAILAELLNLLG